MFGNAHTVVGPVDGVQLASPDDHAIAAGLPTQRASSVAEPPGSTGPGGVALIAQVGGAKRLTSILSQSPAYCPPAKFASVDTLPYGSDGKLHDTIGPLVGVHDAMQDAQPMDEGTAVHTTVTSAHAPGCTGPDGLAVVRQEGGAEKPTAIVNPSATSKHPP
jgi:hypothetical protein